MIYAPTREQCRLAGHCWLLLLHWHPRPAEGALTAHITSSSDLLHSLSCTGRMRAAARSTGLGHLDMLSSMSRLLQSLQCPHVLLQSCCTRGGGAKLNAWAGTVPSNISTPK